MNLRIIDVYHYYDGPVSGVAKDLDTGSLVWVHATDPLADRRIYECYFLPPVDPKSIRYIYEEDIDWRPVR